MIARALVLLSAFFLFSAGRLTEFTITVIAKNTSGSPVAGADVTVVAPGGLTIKGVTGPNGAVTFYANKAGTADITVSSEIYGSAHATVVLVD